MKVRHLFIYMSAALVASPFIGAAASAATIEVVSTFNVGGIARNTEPQKINDQGDVVGAVVDPVAAITRGFYRENHGSLTRTFVDPNDTGNVTQGRGINNSREICGNYTDASDGSTHGFLLDHHVFAAFDLTDVASTIPLGINNAGEIAGSFVASDDITQEAFLSSGSTVTTFGITDATATLAYQVNGSDQATGYYVDADGVTHGYLRDADGTLTYPIDPDGSTGTILFGNNDSNWVVGRYSDADGVTHGLFFTAPGEFVTFDYPGSAFTSLNGINNQGLIVGRYVDADGIEHGLIAQVNTSTNARTQNKTLRVMPLKPVQMTPERSGVGAPAM